MKKFTQVKKTIKGTEYIAQFNGFANMYKTIDSTYIEGTQTTSMEKMANYLLENVLVSPKKTMDDFEDREELDAVIGFLGDVNNGSFREETDEEETTGKRKE